MAVSVTPLIPVNVAEPAVASRVVHWRLMSSRSDAKTNATSRLLSVTPAALDSPALTPAKPDKPRPPTVSTSASTVVPFDKSSVSIDTDKLTLPLSVA